MNIDHKNVNDAIDFLERSGKHELANAVRVLMVQAQPSDKQIVECCSNDCTWKGAVSDTRMCGSIGPLCPECGEVTEKISQAVTPGQAMPEITDAMQLAGAQAIRINTTPLNKIWTANAVFKAMWLAAQV